MRMGPIWKTPWGPELRHPSCPLLQAKRRRNRRNAVEVSKGMNYSISVRVNEFTIPPVADGLVLGKDSPIGFAAISKALSLLIADNMQSVEVNDEVISHIIVRRGILRRVPQDRLVAFVLEQVKPLMLPMKYSTVIKAEVVIEESRV